MSPVEFDPKGNSVANTNKVSKKPIDKTDIIGEPVDTVTIFSEQENFAGEADHYYQAYLEATRAGKTEIAQQMLKAAAECSEKNALNCVSEGKRKPYYSAQELEYAAGFYLKLGNTEKVKQLYEMAVDQYLLAIQDQGLSRDLLTECHDKIMLMKAFIAGEITPQDSDQLWAAGHRYFIDELGWGMPELLDGSLFSAANDLEDHAKQVKATNPVLYSKAKLVLAKLYLRIARNYYSKGSKEWAAYYLKQAAGSLKQAGKEVEAQDLYYRVGQMYMRAAANTSDLESRAKNYLEAAMLFEQFEKNEQSKKAYLKAAQTYVFCAQACEGFVPPKYAQASQYYLKAIRLLQQKNHGPEAKKLETKLLDANLMAQQQFVVGQEERALLDGIIGSPTQEKVANAHIRLFKDLENNNYADLDIPALLSPLSGEKLNASSAQGATIDLEAALVGESDPIIRAYYTNLIAQCQVVADMSNVLGKPVGLPPSREEIMEYAKALADSGKSSTDVSQAFNQFALAFFVHIWEVKGCGENISKPGSWADITSKAQYSPDGRWVVDCEGFAFIAMTFFKAAGYEVVGQDMMIAGTLDSAHAFTVIKDPATDELIFTSNADVFYELDELECELKGMGLAEVEKTLTNIPAAGK